MLSFFDVVEADHSELATDCNTSLGEGTNEADSNDVVETKGSSRGIAQVEQLRDRCPATRAVGPRFNQQRRIERDSGILKGEAISGQPLFANQQRRGPSDDGDALVSLCNQMRGSLSRALLVFRGDQRRLETRKPSHDLDDRQASNESLDIAGGRINCGRKHQK